jgi:sirohydrochlorin cobaltochelatase
MTTSDQSSTQSHGILLFAHGARDPAWSMPFEQARHILAEQHAHTGPVALAFLEFMTPNLIDAGEQLAGLGCSRVTVVPMFLGAGGHVRKDLPVLMQQLQDKHPKVDWQLTPAVGQTNEVIQAMAQAASHLALGA